MNVIIAGGGVAGLSAAAVLRKLPFVKSIVIFEPAALSALHPIATDISCRSSRSNGSNGSISNSSHNSNNRNSTDIKHTPNSESVSNYSNNNSRVVSNSHHYNGIWSPALYCLQQIGIYDKTASHFHAVRSSGYKDFLGRWLAQPTVGLQEPPSTYST